MMTRIFRFLSSADVPSVTAFGAAEPLAAAVAVVAAPSDLGGDALRAALTVKAQIADRSDKLRAMAAAFNFSTLRGLDFVVLNDAIGNMPAGSFALVEPGPAGGATYYAASWVDAAADAPVPPQVEDAVGAVLGRMPEALKAAADDARVKAATMAATEADFVDAMAAVGGQSGEALAKALVDLDGARTEEEALAIVASVQRAILDVWREHSKARGQ